MAVALQSTAKLDWSNLGFNVLPKGTTMDLDGAGFEALSLPPEPQAPYNYHVLLTTKTMGKNLPQKTPTSIYSFFFALGKFLSK